MTPLLALLALLLGLFAGLVTPREEEPQIDVTMAEVIVSWPGATVKEVENLLLIPGEQVLSRMTGVEHVYAQAEAGLAVLTVQFKVGVRYNDAVLRLSDTVTSHADWLPAHLGVAAPLIKPRSIDDVPILALTLSDDTGTRSAFELAQVARALEGELKRLRGTRSVTTLGAPDHVIRVLLDPARLAAHAMTPLDLAGVLAAVNHQAVSGSLLVDNREWRLAAGFALRSAEDVRALVVGARNNKPVFLADVADVEDGPDAPRTSVWHHPVKAALDKGEARPAVTVQLTKQPGANAADVAEEALARVERLKGSVIPEGVALTVTRNYGKTASDKAQQLIGKLAFATAFVVLLVGLALGRREALIVGVAVSLTLASTLFASWAWGFTLNRVSLFALIFSIGILVDDAIVVVENIHRWRTLYPERSLLSLIPEAVDEVGGPTILATLTVIAALLPMAFVSGLMGPYMSPIPINASLGMALSLLIAFVITPWLAARWLPKENKHGRAASARLDAHLGAIFGRLLQPFVRSAGAARRRLYLALGVLLAIVGSLALVWGQAVVLKMLPFDNKSEFQIVLDMPAGTPLEETTRVLSALGEALREVPEVTHFQSYAGTASPINFNGLVRQYDLRASPERGDLQVNLVERNARQRSSHAIASALRPTVEAIARAHGGNAKVVEVPPGPPVRSPIVAEIYGPEAGGREQVAKAVRAVLEQTPDVVGVDDSLAAPSGQFDLLVRQEKAARLGVTPQAVVETLRIALAGHDVTPLRDSEGKLAIPVRLTLPDERKSSHEALLQLRMKSGDGALVALSEVVEVSQGERDRPVFRKDQLPVVYVLGDQGGRLDSPLYGLFAARAGVGRIKGADGVPLAEHFIAPPADPYAAYALKWDGEWQVTYETFRDMGIAYAVGLILIYLLVVAHFRRYGVPLVIMAPIPLTLIGVLPGHALLGAPFTATSMIGMIALAGIIVRNSILLVDFIESEVRQGVPLADALIRSAAVRAKPIALTALAAMLGALFILDDPIFNGLAISLIFGILVSTLLTLVVIPVLYGATQQTEQS